MSPVGEGWWLDFPSNTDIFNVKKRWNLVKKRKLEKLELRGET